MRLSKWLATLLLCIPFFAMTAHADYPTRGMKMSTVKTQYGAPQSVRVSTGKVKKQWPRITVWNYGKFSVYFERKTVLHTVVHQ
ncbi:MAG TPA: hypothetical protein PLE99_12760 [Candidatus Thiothrix moscowensis]|uniref:hypothetical protein n=1 Tax=unclassified Thiothrix TaxID=2636184 RepID=UPI0025E26F26|nr:MULTISPECIES: hypothetical protein [unclassified Thiothrix]HRJ53631.1 hypothetical protein [Candidatus Thiothrix moscowensis]HRJ93713.1 hypothetical protein [Candidatus Thiothrix moscowensis]